MNKRQLIVVWIMGIAICIDLWLSFGDFRIFAPRVLFKYMEVFYGYFLFILTVLIIGGLLIYTLRTRKK